MSNSVDNRIVAIEFDNSQFEKDIRKTAESLRTFDDNLNRIGLNGAVEGLEALSNRFSTLKTMGMLVFADLTSSAIKFGTGLMKNVFGRAAGAGKQRALNIEQAEFMLAGMNLDVESAMKSANDAVSGTAFGLDAAAGAAARFASSGVEAGDKMTSALRGVAGVAGMTSSSYEEIADVFSEAAARGTISGNTLARLNSRSFNAAAALAEHFNTTQDEIKGMVREGEISFDVFADLMDKNFGEHAQKANETYAGSLSNVGSALGRIGASFQTTRLESLRQLYVSLIPAINAVHSALEPMINGFRAMMTISSANTTKLIGDFIGLGADEEGKASIAFVERLRAGFENLTYAVGAVVRSIKRIIQAFGEQFQNVFKENPADKFGALTAKIREFAERLEVSEETAAKFATIFAAVLSVFRQFIHIGKGIITVIEAIFEGFSSGSQGGLLTMISRFAEFVTFMAYVGIRAGHIEKIFNAIAKVAGFLAKVLGTVVRVLASAAWTVFSKVAIVLSKILYTIAYNAYQVGKVLYNTFKAGTPAAEAAVDAFNRIKEALSGILPSMESTSSLVDTIRNKFSALGRWIISKLPSSTDMAGIFEGVGDFFVELVNSIGSIIPTLDQVEDAFSRLGNFFVALWDALSPLTSFLWDITTGIFKFFGVLRDTLFSTTVSIEQVGENFDTAGNNMEKFKNFMEGLVTAIKRIGEALWNGVGWIGEQIGTFFGFLGKADVGKFLDDHFGKIVVGTLLVIGYKITNIFKSFTSGDMFGLGKIGDSVSGFFDSLTDGTPEPPKLEALANSMIKIAIAIAILTLATWALTKIDSERLGISIGILAGMLGTVSLAMGTLSKTTMGGASMAVIGTGILLMAGAILLLAGAIAILGKLPKGELDQGTMALAGLLTMLTAMVGLVSRMDSMIGHMVRVGAGILLIAIAITILTIPIFVLGKINYQDLMQGLGGVFLALIAIMVPLQVMRGMDADLLKAGAGILLLAIALTILIIPIMVLGKMDFEQLKQGMASIILLITVIAMSMSLMALAEGDMLKVGAGILLMAIGLLILSGALKIVATIGIGELIVSVLALGALVAVLAYAATKLDGATEGVLGILAIAAAIYIMALAFKQLGSIDMKTLVVSALALVIVIAVLTAAAVAIEKDGMRGSIAIVAMAGAMLVIASALTILADMSLGDAVKSVLIFAVVILILVAVGAVLGMFAPVAIFAAVAMMVLAGVVVIFAASALMMAVAFQIIGNSAEAGSKALVQILTTLIMFIPRLIASIGQGLILLIAEFLMALPTLIMAITEVIVAILQAIRILAPEFMETAVVLITAFLDGFDRIVPRLLETVVGLIMTLMQVIDDNLPEFISRGASIINSLLEGLNEELPEIVANVAELIVTFLDALADHAGDIVEAGIGLVGSLINGLADGVVELAGDIEDFITALIAAIISYTQVIIDGALDLLEAFLGGLLTAIGGVATLITDFLVAMLTAFADEIVNLTNELLTIGINFFNGMAEALETGGQELVDAVNRFVHAVLNLIITAIGNAGGLLAEAGGAILDGLGGALSGIPVIGGLFGAGEELGEAVADGTMRGIDASSPSKLFYKIGGYIVAGLRNALNDDDSAAASAKDLADRSVSAFQKSITNLNHVISTMGEFEPTIAPVLDLSSVEHEAQRLGGILGGHSFDANLSATSARAISSLSNTPSDDTPPSTPEVREIKFEQHNHSPEALSTVDIYNATKSQIQLAKEELELV